MSVILRENGSKFFVIGEEDTANVRKPPVKGTHPFRASKTTGERKHPLCNHHLHQQEPHFRITSSRIDCQQQHQQNAGRGPIRDNDSREGQVR